MRKILRKFLAVVLILGLISQFFNGFVSATGDK
jgi:hypothetical protein